jgi:hypothetical protein
MRGIAAVARRTHRRHRRSHPDLCRSRALLGGARFLRPRRRPLFHDAPNILHYGRANEGPEMREGMIFTIEPMINLGRPHVKVLADGWTAVTRDRSLSAQYEHAVGVTADGCEIFTLSPGGLDRPGLPT